MSLADVVSAFGAEAKRKLTNQAATGAPEDQLRAPLETLIKGMAELCGQPANAITAVGETTLAHLATRPDYSITRRNELVGFIEVKAPGKGADPRHFTEQHDKTQWAKLKTLPNLIYTDGNSFSLWQDGEWQGRPVPLEGDVRTSGKALTAPLALQTIFESFFAWQPIAPRTAKQLAETSARYCRLLREEVKEELERNNPGLTTLGQEWRNLLFPQADADQFADGYAQAVTFGLLVARVRDVDLSKGLDSAANELRKSSTLIGTALRLLVDDPDVKKALATSLDTLRRVLNVVDWQTVTKGNPDAWLYFYEDFLEVYDNTLRKKTGSYYTPPEVVEAMVRLTDEALRDPGLFDRREGLAAPSVTICDPAVGTGTFLLGVLKRISETIAADQGEGAVPSAIAAALDRIIGFELQFGPFAVAQLRIIAEMQALIGDTACIASPRLYVTDTLGDPYAAETQFSPMVAAIGESRKEANKIKRETPITVVIGNPPYKERASGRGGWIESGSVGREAPMLQWMPPPGWGVGAFTNKLKNLYVFFWRWASLMVFGSGWQEATGENSSDRSGIVCFITMAGFLAGPAFKKMREELRRDCAAIWIIDCSPEGHQPEVNTRIFQDVQQPVCILLAARTLGKDRQIPAVLKYMTLPAGHREQIKFQALRKISLNDLNWVDAPSGWREPFLPQSAGAWAAFPALSELLVWSSPGVMTHRTWVIAPDKQSLEMRWEALRGENDPAAKDELFHPDRDRTLTRVVSEGLGTQLARVVSVDRDTGPVVPPVRFASRSFDRRWLIPDKRLISQPRPPLWAEFSQSQVYFTVPEDRAPTSGPSLTISGVIPDVHHYNARGGRVYPLWRNAEATASNVKPALVAYLAAAYGRAVTPEDVMAYLAAVMAHPAFTARFQKDLVRPGLHVPLTASADLFGRAVDIGCEVIWLHTYGERFANPNAGRQSGAPRMAQDGPSIPRAGAIPSDPENFPNELRYDSATQRLFIGNGYVENVTQQMFDYDVSGMNVLKQWFSYRKKDRSRPIIGDRRPPSPLSDIQPDHWLAEYTSDLINLLHVLGRLIALEPQQAALVDEILAAPLIDVTTLTEAGALQAPPAA